MFLQVIFLFLVPPSIIESPQSTRTEVAGISINYTCSASGYPPPNITWTHSHGLTTGTTSQTVNEAAAPPIVTSVYTLVYLNLDNVGDYNCTASNYIVETHSNTSSIGRLALQCTISLNNYILYNFYTFLDPTNISITPTNLVKAFNEQGSFICHGFGIPHPTLTWYKNNVAVTSSFAPKLSLSESTGTERGYTVSILTLTISNTAKSDEANYTCCGVNNITNNIGVPDQRTGQFLIECTNLTLCFLTVHSLIHLTVHLSIHPSIHLSLIFSFI